MTEFRKKMIGTTGTLGERLRLVREEARVSVEEVGRKIHVNPKYITAIEESRYQDLPGAVYARNFVRQYAAFLNIREDAALEVFEREYSITTKLTPEPISEKTNQPSWGAALLAPRGIRRSIILLLASAVLVYLGIEIRNITAAPELAIISPPEQLTTTERSVELKGTTEPEVTVTVNGRTILVDRQGVFHDTLDLQDGLNTIVIHAAKKRGGSTTVTRNVLVTLSP